MNIKKNNDMKNINKTFKYMAMAAAALPMSLAMLTSCSNENEEILTRSEVKFTTAISGAIESRADVAYTPTAGDLTLYYNALGGTQKATYGYGEKGWACTGISPLYWEDLGEQADYTFYAVAPVANMASGEVAANQSTAEDFIASDLLMARTTVTEVAKPVNLVLKHLMGKIVVNVLTTENNDALTADELASTNVGIKNLKTAYTVAQGETEAVPATATASGDTNTDLTPYMENDAYSYIAPPQSLAGMELEFDVTIGSVNRTYIYKVGEIDAPSLAAGTITTFNITISKTKMTLGDVTVTDWATGESENVTINYSSIQIGTITGAATGDKLTLNLLDKTGSVAATATYTYGADGWTSDAPIYWNSIMNDANYSGTFTALYMAADGTWSTAKTDNVAHGAAPSFSTLTQAMAKMTIKLEAGDGITDIDTEVTGRAVALKKSTTTPAVNTDGTPATITLGSLENIAFDNGDTFVIAPQTFTDDNLITLTRANGNAYKLKLNSLTDVFGTDGIQPGKHYAITLTVSETAVGISASIEPWTEVNGSGTVTPDFE